MGNGPQKGVPLEKVKLIDGAQLEDWLAVVVDTVAAARELAGKSNLVFLARGEAARAPGQLGDAGPTLVPLGRQQAVKKGTLLERPSSFAMADVLVKMNQPRAYAEALAKGCGRSLTALARRIPGGICEVPDWVEHAHLLLPGILAGGWDPAARRRVEHRQEKQQRRRSQTQHRQEGRGKAHRQDVEYLRVAVRALRLKIEADPSQPVLIRNEPGIGYRLS